MEMNKSAKTKFNFTFSCILKNFGRHEPLNNLMEMNESAKKT